MYNKETFLSCDNCPNTFGVDNMAMGYNSKELREQAKKDDWVYKNGKDLCPECKEQSSKKLGNG